MSLRNLSTIKKNNYKEFIDEETVYCNDIWIDIRMISSKIWSNKIERYAFNHKYKDIMKDRIDIKNENENLSRFSR